MESHDLQFWTRIGTMNHPRRVGRGVLTAPRALVVAQQVRRRGEDTQPYLPVYGKAHRRKFPTSPPPHVGGNDECEMFR